MPTFADRGVSRGQCGGYKNDLIEKNSMGGACRRTADMRNANKILVRTLSRQKI
jgi:hypothetical protein